LNEVIIRKANKNDIAQVRELSNIPGLQVAGESRAPSEKWFNSFIEEKQLFFVAEKATKIVGFIVGERVTGNIGYLWEIGTNQNLRSKGIGSSLLNKFVEECEKRKFRFIIAYGHENKKTLNFFRKNNFISGADYKELRLDLKNF